MKLEDLRPAVRQFIQHFSGIDLDGPTLITRLSLLDPTLSFPSDRELNQAWAVLRTEAASLPEHHPVKVALMRKDKKRSKRKKLPGAQGQEYEVGEQAGNIVESCIALLCSSQDWLSRDLRAIMMGQADGVGVAEAQVVVELQMQRNAAAEGLESARQNLQTAQECLQRLRNDGVSADTPIVQDAARYAQEKESEVQLSQERLMGLEAQLAARQAHVASMEAQARRLRSMQEEVLPAIQLICEKLPLYRPPDRQQPGMPS